MSSEPTEGDDAGNEGERDQRLSDEEALKLSEREELLGEWYRHASFINRHDHKVRSWNFQMGPIGFSASLGSMRIMHFFVYWHLITAISGVLVTIFWTSNRALGIALVVGSLFAFGSFVSQAWAQAITREREFITKVRMEDDLEELRESLKQERELRRRLIGEDRDS